MRTAQEFMPIIWGYVKVINLFFKVDSQGTIATVIFLIATNGVQVSSDYMFICDCHYVISKANRSGKVDHLIRPLREGLFTLCNLF